jgi:hypothetical protein
MRSQNDGFIGFSPMPSTFCRLKGFAIFLNGQQQQFEHFSLLVCG